VAGFVLCLHDAGDGAGGPSQPVDHHGDGHCVFCCISTHFSLASPTQTALHYENAAVSAAWTALADWCSPSISYHSIAQPRGPPILT
jgi:hypothetical protein